MDDEMVDEIPLAVVLVSTVCTRSSEQILVQREHEVYEFRRRLLLDVSLRSLIHIAHHDNVWMKTHSGDTIGEVKKCGMSNVALLLCLCGTTRTAG